MVTTPPDGADTATADHTTLRLVHLPAPPDLSAMDVKHTVEHPLLGATATVRVIGSSHCLSLPAHGFHELCSCRPLPDVGVSVHEGERGPGSTSPDRQRAPATDPRTGTTVAAGRVRQVPLEPGVERTVTTTTGAVRARTTLAGHPLDAFPTDREFDVHYRFGPDAVTTVDLEDDRFETFHTYPEFDLAVRSETVLSPASPDPM